jgi:hypothetical protein
MLFDIVDRAGLDAIALRQCSGLCDRLCGLLGVTLWSAWRPERAMSQQDPHPSSPFQGEEARAARAVFVAAIGACRLLFPHPERGRIKVGVAGRLPGVEVTTVPAAS